MHDADEVITGDPPCQHDKPVPIPEDEDEQLIKAMDLLQAWWFIRQWGTGDHAAEVESKCRVAYHDYMSKLARDGHRVWEAVSSVEREL